MKVIVFDVAAESGGALTILNKYYNEAFQRKDIEWHFILSTPHLESKENVYVYNYPWIKKSWLHRLFFDVFNAHRIVNELDGDIVFSLQNILILFTKVEQIVYFHQVLPFASKRFGLFENPLFWVYQNIIGKLIIYSVKKADKVIVQANWIKELFINEYNVDTKKIEAHPPKLNITISKHYKTALHNNKTLFFYPASAAVYKNHKLIVEVTKKLISKGYNSFEITFTLSGRENDNIKKLRTIVNKYNLPITFIGHLESSEVYEMYCKSILLFPSYLESYPLPLEEAKMHNTPIIVSDLEYAKEILRGYNEVQYFNPFVGDSLFEILRQQINKSI